MSQHDPFEFKETPSTSLRNWRNQHRNIMFLNPNGKTLMKIIFLHNSSSCNISLRFQSWVNNLNSLLSFNLVLVGSRPIHLILLQSSIVNRCYIFKKARSFRWSHHQIRSMSTCLFIWSHERFWLASLNIGILAPLT